MVWYHLYTDITSPPFASLRNSFFSKKKKSESFNTKRIMQLHLRCHSRKSRHKFVVQLRRMLLVRVFNGHKNVPHANDRDDQTPERSYENGSMTFYRMNL